MTIYQWILKSFIYLMIITAQAQLCSITSPVILPFGQTGSYTIATTMQRTSTQSAGFQCSGMQALPKRVGEQVKAKAFSTNNFLLKKTTGESIPYIAAASDNNNFLFTQNGTIDYLAVYGKTRPIFPLYLRTIPGANISAGRYTDTITLEWSWWFCTKRNIVGKVCQASEGGLASSRIEISLTVTNDCQIKVPEITFGTAAFPADFPVVHNRLQVSCTKGIVYYVGIDGGNNPFSGRRQMTGSMSKNKLQYDIFNSQTNQLWTNDRSGWVSATGEGNNACLQNFPFRAEIYKDQAAQPAGIYKDQVRVNVYF